MSELRETGGEELQDGLEDYPGEDAEEIIEEETAEEEAEPSVEDEAEEESEEERPQQQQRRPGRRERQRAERRELRELQEENARLRREFEGFRSQSSAPRVDPAEQARRDQAERDQVAQLPYDQQINYWRDKDRREFSAAFQTQQLTTLNAIDRSNFDNACRADPVRDRLRPEVEQMVASENAAGRYPTREQVFYYLLGQEADRRRRSQSGQRTRAQAARRVRRETTRPASTGSDVGRSRVRADDNSYEAALQRISGRPIWS